MRQGKNVPSSILCVVAMLMAALQGPLFATAFVPSTSSLLSRRSTTMTMGLKNPLRSATSHLKRPFRSSTTTTTTTTQIHMSDAAIAAEDDGEKKSFFQKVS